VTAEDLPSLRDRLRYTLDTEEAGDEFSRLEDDYYETARALAREAIPDLAIMEPGDRERFLVANEVYDLCDEVSRARWSKVRAFAVRLMGSESTTLPENLIGAEREYLLGVLELREGRR
jgi:hypothetical protein